MNSKSNLVSGFIALTLTAPMSVRLCAAQTAFRKPVAVAPAQKVIAPAETGLIDIARERGLNVLIDSSSLNPAAQVDALEGIPRGPEGDVVNVVAYYIQQHHLSAERLSPDTFVFWAEPDQDKMVQAILRGEGFGAEQEMKTPDELLTALRLQLDPQGAEPELAAIREAAARPLTPKEKFALKLKQSPPLALEWSLSQLPADLQQSLAAKVINSSLESDPILPDSRALWARDEVWQQARISYRPGNARFGGEQTLVVQAQVENQENRLLLSFFPSTGVAGAETMRDAKGVPLPVTPGLTQRQVRVLPIAPGAAPATILNLTQRSAGAGLKSLQAMTPAPFDFGAQPGFEAAVSLDAVRQPLGEFLRRAAQAGGVQLLISPELEAIKPLISAHLQQMPLAQLMQAVSHTYGAKWTKGEAQTYTLNASQRSALEMDLLRVGQLTWYRSRDVVAVTRQRQTEEFNALAARVFDEAGEAIIKLPGVAFTALPGETQTELRQTAKSAMARRFLREEIGVRDLMNAQWSFRLVGSPSRGVPPFLTLLLNGQPGRNLMWNSPRSTFNPKPTPQMAP